MELDSKDEKLKSFLCEIRQKKMFISDHIATGLCQ